MTVTKQAPYGLYHVDQPEPLVCQKCHLPVEFILGEEEEAACEACYVPSKNPTTHPMPTEAVGERDQVAELRGEPQRETAESLLVKLGIKK